MGSDGRRETFNFFQAPPNLYHPHAGNAWVYTTSPTFNCCFNSKLLMTNNVGHLFYMFICPVCYLFSWGVCSILLLVFFNRAVYFLKVNSPSSLYILFWITVLDQILFFFFEDIFLTACAFLSLCMPGHNRHYFQPFVSSWMQFTLILSGSLLCSLPRWWYFGGSISPAVTTQLQRTSHSTMGSGSQTLVD